MACSSSDREQTDPVKQQVAAHWNRRAAHFDEDLGRSIRTAAERAAWDRILDLTLPAAILELTTDPAARAAIEDLIRQTCDRLSKIDKAKHHRPPAQNPGPSPASKGRGRGAVGLWGRPLKVELAKFCTTGSDI